MWVRIPPVLVEPKPTDGSPWAFPGDTPQPERPLPVKQARRCRTDGSIPSSPTGLSARYANWQKRSGREPDDCGFESHLGQWSGVRSQGSEISSPRLLTPDP